MRLLCPLKSSHLHVAGERASYGSDVASPLSRRPSMMSRGKWRAIEVLAEDWLELTALGLLALASAPNATP
jgi:hypothetical protein